MRGPLEFAVFADSEGNDHPFTNKRGSYFVWNNLTAEVNRTGVKFVVGLGDFFDSGEGHHWRRFQKRFGRFRIPFFPVLGEKDVSSVFGKLFFKTIFGNENYAFEAFNCKFVFLDNSFAFSESQLAWLESELRMSNKRKFVFLHRSPLESEEFTRLLGLYKVEAVFAGHLHRLLHEEKDGVSYWTTGGAGGELESNGLSYHFLKVRIEDNGPVTVMAVPLSNSPFNSRALEKGSLTQ